MHCQKEPKNAWNTVNEVHTFSRAGKRSDLPGYLLIFIRRRIIR